MLTIRELFHEIGNLHNKISVTAGVTKGELLQRFKDSPMPQETEKMINRLTELEQYVVEAGKCLIQLNIIIYDVINPDTGKPYGDSVNISNTIRKIIVQRLKVKEEQIIDDTNFARDLGMDSLAGVEIVLDLEQRFGIEIPDREAEKLLKFKQVVDYIQKKLTQKKK